ncbi:rod shape-determining protein MreC [Glaciecola petra]|uniref:Cell shape-determining protein MreC n=1 Tax=Glaciecola petra TaxID=3075602 RepID=A0ABU2ZUC5_9ALTE|nr:rod shape-determining protein MreC [Aestuariibacter sp. P117]MDT0595643.1 rod shape-determining protein MreC [Aestuariibacter sp. P117]
MNKVFARGPSLFYRLCIVLTLSVIGMVMDAKVESVSTARTYLTSLVSPLQYVADMPGAILDWSASRFTSRQTLLVENERLTNKITLMNEKLQRFTVLKQENENLRRLLDAPVQSGMHRMIAELMAVDNNPYSHQIVINKGAIHDVYEGQPVLDDTGIVGQIVEVGTTNSRVLLISDITHAIPVRISRNNVSVIAGGAGVVTELSLEHVAHSADLQEGDLLVSSGLGKVFPEGYPVGVIESIVRDESKPFSKVTAQTSAQLDRIKYLLLLWPPESAPADSLSPDQLGQKVDE